MNRICVIFLLTINFQAIAQSDSLIVFFEKNSSYLSEIEKEKLNLDSTISKIEILAFTDYLGSSKYNLWLSKKRAERVKSILINNKINTNLINRSIGNGELPNNGDSTNFGSPRNRKAIILIWKTEIISEKNEPIIDIIPAEKKEFKHFDSIAVGENLSISNLSFIGGQHNLTPNSEPSLKLLLDYLTENENVQISIEGHICCETAYPDGLDNETGLYNLSVARAKAIYDHLVLNGIESNRLKYEGFGRDKPIYPKERNELEQQSNRRVEFKILDK
jgi:outer membrane protein OmpA-like peptidoglycan-associated protein